MAEQISGEALPGTDRAGGAGMFGGTARVAEPRRRLLDLSVGLVETVSGSGPGRGTGPEDISRHFQVALPYRGVFVWLVGRDEVVGDPDQVLFVTGGESYRMRQPVPGGYTELIVTPEISTLSEIARASGDLLRAHPFFLERSRRASPGLRAFRDRFLCWAGGASADDDLAAEELLIALLRTALDGGSRRSPAGRTNARLIGRTKAFLEAELANPIRLADIGRAVGASPAYLTDMFRRSEGLPLHQYLTQLRLARALADLPHAEDLTTLALDAGFSSHSHFSAAFRRAFWITPSRFRHLTRGRTGSASSL
jgi:AraC-like DNA-binding protein